MNPLPLMVPTAHSVGMTDSTRRLTGDELEQFYNDHGGRKALERHLTNRAFGVRIDAWDDSWSPTDDLRVPANDFHVYRHEGRRPSDQ